MQTKRKPPLYSKGVIYDYKNAEVPLVKPSIKAAVTYLARVIVASGSFYA
jgi:hypothetical protein